MTKKIKFPKGIWHKRFRKDIADNLDIILNGKLLIIDPASVSLGYAVVDAGEVIESGSILLDGKAPIHLRLRDIVETLNQDDEYAVLGVELIRGNFAHAYLKFAVGAVMAGANAKVCIEIPIQSWHPLREADYVKSDALDAELMAKTMITLAKEIQDENT